MKCILLGVILVSSTVHASVWGPIYPFIQKTEDGKIKCHSFPYAVYDGPATTGETFVYQKGKLLYTIDKYLANPFFTTENGRYLMELSLRVYHRSRSYIMDDNGKETLLPPEYSGNVINIYKDGSLMRSITFEELQIDTTRLSKTKFSDGFYLGYSKSENETDSFRKKMASDPVFYRGDTLFLITADEQLIQVSISKGEIIGRTSALKGLSNVNWSSPIIERKFQKRKYPQNFLLPKLRNGKTIEDALAEFLNLKPSKGRDDATIQIYIGRLLIDRSGRCVYVYVSPVRKDTVKDDFGYKADEELLEKIDTWLTEQRYSRAKFPRVFPKYCFKDFIYLK